MKEGTCIYFNDKKGFGFLHLEDGKDIFFHITALIDKKKRNVKRGDKFKFDIESYDGKFKAVNIVHVEDK